MRDVTPELRDAVRRSRVRDGMATVSTPHTTCAVFVNENEARLHADLLAWLRRLAPPLAGYKHDDIHLRFPPPSGGADVDAWRRQEPVNAQAHLQASLLGSSVSLPVTGGEPVLGVWQSVLFAELDGPRCRTVAIHIMGNAP